MKKLEAYEVKDGWLVSISETHHVKTESEVNMLVRQHGLKVTARLRRLRNFDNTKIIRAE